MKVIACPYSNFSANNALVASAIPYPVKFVGLFVIDANE